MALAIAGFPMDKMTVEQVQNTLAGGNQVCADAGVPIAGGHTIDAPEPIYGLAVVGLVHPDKIKRNNAAKDGDVLILGKGLGVGILGAALNNDQLDNIGYGELIKSAVKLNSIGNELSEIPGVPTLRASVSLGIYWKSAADRTYLPPYIGINFLSSRVLLTTHKEVSVPVQVIETGIALAMTSL